MKPKFYVRRQHLLSLLPQKFFKVVTSFFDYAFKINSSDKVNILVLGFLFVSFFKSGSVNIYVLSRGYRVTGQGIGNP